MSARYAELAWAATPMGEVSLRRRFDLTLKADVHEVRLGEEFLMSSAFVVAEEELAHLGLAAADGDALDVVVGGLGLGYTAAAALADPRVASLRVVDALDAVVDWHEQGLLPLSAGMNDDPRCTYVRGDFFALAAAGGLGRPDVVLLDVDHTPRHVLHPGHAAFYTPAGVAGLAAALPPGGVFALWSDDPPDEPLLDVLRGEFRRARGQVVTFPNPFTGGESTNSVLVAVR